MRMALALRKYRILSLLLVAALVPIPGLSLAESIQIESNRLEVTRKEQKAVFSGAVKLTRGDLELHANRLVAYYNEKGLSQGLVRAKADGDVTIAMGKSHGKSDQALMDYRKGIIKLIGHAEVVQEGGTIKGGTIIYDMNRDTVQVLQGDSKRVRVHIESAGNPQKTSR